MWRVKSRKQEKGFGERRMTTKVGGGRRKEKRKR